MQQYSDKQETEAEFFAKLQAQKAESETNPNYNPDWDNLEAMKNEEIRDYQQKMADENAQAQQQIADQQIADAQEQQMIQERKDAKKIRRRENLIIGGMALYGAVKIGGNVAKTGARVGGGLLRGLAGVGSRLK